MTTAKRRLGTAGEQHARRLLERGGYRFVTANWRCSAGELDLVMRDGDELVFVEVKVRRGEALGLAEAALTKQQGQRIMRAAACFLDERRDYDDVIWRVDVVAITLAASGAIDRLSHLVNVVTSD